MEGRLLLNVVVRESAAILELLSGENQTLLIGRDALLVLNLGLHVVNGIGRLNLEGDGLACEGLNKDLHTTAEAKDEMESGLLLDVIVGEGAAVFELLTGKDEALLVGRNTLLVLNLGLNIVDSVGRLDLKSNSLASKGLDEDLHATTEAEYEMEGRLLLNVVVRESTTVLKLLTSEDKALLIRRDALLILDLGLDVVNSVGWLDLESDGLTSESLDENLHVFD